MTHAVAKLIVRQGPLKDTEYPLTETVNNIGREPFNDIVIKLPALSRRHVRIIVDDQGYLLEDLDTTNGTYLNGERISGSVWLQPGDEIDLAKSIRLAFSDGQYLPPEDTGPIPLTAPTPTIATAATDATMIQSAATPYVAPIPETTTAVRRSCFLPLTIFLIGVIITGLALLYLADSLAPNTLYCGPLEPLVNAVANLLSSLTGSNYQPIACPIS